MPKRVFRCMVCGDYFLEQILIKNGTYKCPICGKGPVVFEHSIITTKAEATALRRRRGRF